MNNQAPVLTISLLASNRPDTIRKCLDSLRPIMDAIACELILVDTSKSEQIHSILCEYTDQVYEFEWCNDFSKARNVGLQKARGEWFLFLDDDEWFIDAEGVISFFQTGEYKKYGYANYVVRNYMDIHYSTYSDGYVTRMVRLDEDTEFKSKVHEYLYPIQGARKDIDALVGHSGYVFETEEKKRAHFKRNYELLLDMLREEPENVRWKMQMVQELSAIGEWGELLTFCQEQISKGTIEIGSYDTVYGNPALGTFYAGCAQGFLRLKKYKECICFCEEAFRNTNNTEVLKTQLYFYMAECYEGLCNWQLAEEYVKRYLEQAQSLVKNLDLMRSHKMVALLGETFDENHIRNAYHKLICIGLKQNRVDELSQYYAQLGLDQKVVTIAEEVLESLYNALLTMDTESILVKLLEDSYHNDGLRKYFSDKMLEAVRNDAQSIDALVKTYAQVNVCNGDVLFAKAYVASDVNEKEELRRLYCQMRQVESAINKEFIEDSDDDILQKFYDYMVGMLEYYLVVCPEEWFEGTMEHLPRDARGAACLNQMFGRGASDVEGKLSDLRECVKNIPELGEKIKRLAECITNVKENAVNEQLLQMVKLMKEKIRFMIEQGLRKEALDVIRQVQDLAPWDQELVELEEEILNE